MALSIGSSITIQLANHQNKTPTSNLQQAHQGLYKSGVWGTVMNYIGQGSNSLVYRMDQLISYIVSAAKGNHNSRLKALEKNIHQGENKQGQRKDSKKPTRKDIINDLETNEYTSTMKKSFDHEIKVEQAAKQAGIIPKKDSLTKRIAIITLASIAFIFMLPFSILGVLGRMLSQTGRAEFTFLTSNTPPLHTPPTQFKAMTFNVALSESATMNIENGVIDPAQRYLAIGNHILDSKPDVVALQEAFHPEHTYKLAQQLQDNGYHVLYAGKPAGLGFLNSGGLIASRYPITDFDFLRSEFTAQEKKEGKSMQEGEFANKGTLVVSLDIPGQEKPLIVSNLHGVCGIGNAETNPKKDKLKPEKQKKAQQNFENYKGFIDQSIDFVDHFARNHGSTEVISLMDGNFSRLKHLNKKGEAARHHKRNLETSYLNKGYKDSNYANISKSLADVKRNHQDINDNFSIKDMEALQGTTFNQDTYHFHYARQIFQMELKNRLKDQGITLKDQTIQELIHLVSKGKDFKETLEKKLGTATNANIFMNQYQTLEKEFLNERFSRKLAIPDHIFIKQDTSDTSALRNTGYQYKSRVAFDPSIGLLSDHCSVEVTYKVNKASSHPNGFCPIL